jgi:hypothetical protein
VARFARTPAGIQPKEVAAVDLPFVTLELQHSSARRNGHRPAGGSLRRRLPRVVLAFLGMLCVPVGVWGGWVLAGGADPTAISLPDWLALVSEPTPAVGANRVPLRITTEPDQASVSLDGHERGKTPLTLVVSPGPHRLLLKHPDAIDEQRQLTVTGDLNLDVSLWSLRPTAVQLRPAYPGASISDAAFLTDGRLSLSMALPGQTANPDVGMLESWIFDPDTGSLKPLMESGSSRRAAVLSVSPNGRYLGYLRHDQSTVQSAGTSPRLDEVWVTGAHNSAPPARLFALPPLSANPGSVPDEVEELHDLVWTPDGQHLLVTARLVSAFGSYATAPRSRVLLVDAVPTDKELASSAPVELVILPADVVPGSYSWGADGHWVAFLTRARLAPGSADFLALCALDTSAGGAVAGFRYVADLGRQPDPASLRAVAGAAWEPSSDGRLVYAAATPRTTVTNPLGLPITSGGEAGLFLATPTGPALTAEEGRRLGTATGVIAPAWQTTDGPDGARLLILARSDQGNKPLVLRGIDPVDGTVRNLGVELSAAVGGSGVVAGRWDLAHRRLLVLARRDDGSNAGQLDYWLVQLQAKQGAR